MPSSRMPLPSSQTTSNSTPRDSSSRAVSAAVGGAGACVVRHQHRPAAHGAARPASTPQPAAPRGHAPPALHSSMRSAPATIRQASCHPPALTGAERAADLLVVAKCKQQRARRRPAATQQRLCRLEDCHDTHLQRGERGLWGSLRAEDWDKGGKLPVCLLVGLPPPSGAPLRPWRPAPRCSHPRWPPKTAGASNPAPSALTRWRRGRAPLLSANRAAGFHALGARRRCARGCAPPLPTLRLSGVTGTTSVWDTSSMGRREGSEPRQVKR